MVSPGPSSLPPGWDLDCEVSFRQRRSVHGERREVYHEGEHLGVAEGERDLLDAHVVRVALEKVGVCEHGRRQKHGAVLGSSGHFSSKALEIWRHFPQQIEDVSGRW
eukprot:89635-Rhodomonas_salina.2